MSANTSPSMNSLSLNSPSTADSSETDATSQSSTFPDDLTLTTDVKVANNDSKNFPWILHRTFECQLSRELPLRIMFAFNAGQKLPTLKQAHRYWNYGHQGKLLIAFLSAQQKITPSLNDATLKELQNPPSGLSESINPDHHTNDRFMDKGNEFLLDIDFTSIEQGRRQSEGMPPYFVKNLCLNTAFTEDYAECDFAQALTGLDYLRDVEVTRRASLREAAERLGITKENWRDVLAEDPDAKEWVENMQALELDVSLYYATVFVDLRIWTMIHVLQEPFYKPNVLAMLNTLFPPSVKELPNDKIDKATLYKYRAHFYHYAMAVEKQGPEVLKHWIDGLLKPGTKHSWPETRKNLVLYFERADNMIEASIAVHGIDFFRERSSKCSATTPSLSERPQTGDSVNTCNTGSQRSHQSQVSLTGPSPRSPGRVFDSSKIRQQIFARRKISTLADQKTYSEPPDSPWASQETFRTSNESTRSRSRTPSMAQASRSGTSTPQRERGSLRSRSQVQSRPATPLVEQGSEAANHDSFTRPITPFEDKRREVIARRETVTGPPKTVVEINQILAHTPELGGYQNSRTASGKLTKRCVTAPLPNDNLEFLKHPYEPSLEPRPLPPIPTLKKKSSFGSLFLRRKSPAASIATLRDDFDNDSQNALGIEMDPVGPLDPLRLVKSTEVFPRYSQDVPSEGGHPFRHQVSLNDVEKTKSRTSVHSFRSPAASGFVGSGLCEIAEDHDFKRKLRKQTSLPNIMFQKRSNALVMRQKFVATGNDYERITVIDVPLRTPRPATSHGPTKKQEPRKAKSFASIRSWGTTDTADTKKTFRPRKSSNFRCEPVEGETIRGKTISEPFPMELQNCPALLPPESKSKEYTRKWFIEHSRAERYDLNPPEGDPVKEFEEKVEGKKGGLTYLKFPLLWKEKNEHELEVKEFEFPRATPKIPSRPNRQRWDSIFPKRVVEKKNPTTHTPIEVGRYAKIPGKTYYI